MYTETKEGYQDVMIAVTNLFNQGPDWVTFFRKVLGPEGIIRSAITDSAQMAAFEQSEAFDSIQRMVAKLREQKAPEGIDTEPTRVITVRMPLCLHQFLQNEAHDKRTSMNKLCISKLMQIVDEELVPRDGNGAKTAKSAPAGPIAASHIG